MHQFVGGGPQDIHVLQNGPPAKSSWTTLSPRSSVFSVML